MSAGRGIEPAALALRVYTDALLDLRELEAKTLAAVDELLRAERNLYEQANVHAKAELGRELGTVLAMRRGDPLWDREPTESLRAVG